MLNVIQVGLSCVEVVLVLSAVVPAIAIIITINEVISYYFYTILAIS